MVLGQKDSGCLDLSKAGKSEKGSHVRLEKYSGGKIIKLTVPLHSELKRGTLRRIIKDASLTLNKFLELK